MRSKSGFKYVIAKLPSLLPQPGLFPLLSPAYPPSPQSCFASPSSIKSPSASHGPSRHKPKLRSTTIKKIASATLFIAYLIYGFLRGKAADYDYFLLDMFTFARFKIMISTHDAQPT